MLEAAQAKTMATAATGKELTPERKNVLDLIEKAATVGDTSIRINYPNVVIAQADVLFFERLGYVITDETNGDAKAAHAGAASTPETKKGTYIIMGTLSWK